MSIANQSDQEDDRKQSSNDIWFLQLCISNKWMLIRLGRAQNVIKIRQVPRVFFMIPCTACCCVNRAISSSFRSVPLCLNAINLLRFEPSNDVRRILIKKELARMIFISDGEMIIFIKISICSLLSLQRQLSLALAKTAQESARNVQQGRKSSTTN